MNDKLIEQLAEKFNTTVGHLWEVLLRQAKIVAIEDAVVLLFWFVAFLCSLKFLRVTYVKCDSKYEGYGWDSELIVVAWCVVTFIVIVLSVCIATDGVELVAATFNPEYWALNELVKSK